MFPNGHQPIFGETESIPRKKPRMAMKTLGDVLYNQHQIDISPKHLDSKE